MDDIIPQDTPLKQCSKCKKFFPATPKFFYVCKSKASGFASQCKVCRYDATRRTPKVPEGYKWCPKCGEFKPATTEYFSRSRRARTGLESHCKACRKKKHPIDLEHVGMRQCTNCQDWKPANLEYFYAEKLGKGGLMSRCKVCICKITNTEERRQYQQQYKSLNAERYRVYFSGYFRSHRAERYANRHTYRARKKRAEGTYTAQQIREQYDRQKGKCYYCHNKVEWGKHHIDHTFPISREYARNSIDHLVITCRPCNLKKGDKYPWEFFEGGRLM